MVNKNEPILIKQLFAKNNSCLGKILKMATELKQLNLVFQEVLHSELAKHCYIAELEKNSITIIVDSASWVTVLRYAIPDIIKTLRAHSEFEHLQTIRYKIAQYQTIKP